MNTAQLRILANYRYMTDELKKAGKFVRKASVRDLRRDRYDRSQSQADIVVENMTPDGVPVLVDIGVTHSLLLGVALSAPIIGTPRVNRTRRCTSQIVSRFCISK